MTLPPLRSDLEQLPRYVPGQPPVAAGFKLSSNELPAPPDPAVIEAVARSASTLNRYPDIAAEPLAVRLGLHLGVEAGCVVPGAGSIAALQQLIQACVDPGRSIVFAWRSYEAYPILARVCHARAITVPLVDHAHDLTAMAAAVRRSDAAMVVVCNPNNPTGTTVDSAALERFLDRIPEDCVVVVDEAYHEFVTDPGVPDGIELARSRGNVVVLRTFSKAHGLAGARVGYAVAPAPIATAMRAVALPFTVSSIAATAALAALDSWPRQRAVVAEVCERRDRFLAALGKVGVLVPWSQANFVWLPWTAGSAALSAQLDSAGISVRPFVGDGLRVTIGESEPLETVVRLSAALSG